MDLAYCALFFYTFASNVFVMVLVIEGDLKTLVIEGDSDRGRGGKRNPQNKDKFRPRSKSKGRLRGFYNGSLHTSRSIVDTTERIEGELIMLS